MYYYLVPHPLAVVMRAYEAFQTQCPLAFQTGYRDGDLGDSTPKFFFFKCRECSKTRVVYDVTDFAAWPVGTLRFEQVDIETKIAFEDVHPGSRRYCDQINMWLRRLIDELPATEIVDLREGDSNLRSDGSPVKPRKPMKPDNRDDREAWFRYKLACDKAGIKYTHGDLAADLLLSKGYTKTLFAMWKQGIDEAAEIEENS